VSTILKALAVGTLFVAGFPTVRVYAQQSPETPAAPVPTQIASSKKVFISNSGEESIFGLDERYSGGPNRTYNQFYAAMKDWGRYELVSAPADADLVFEIGFNERSERYISPQIKLVILDPKTHVALWTFTKYVEAAGMAKNREKNYDLAMTGLMDDLKKLVGIAPIH